MTSDTAKTNQQIVLDTLPTGKLCTDHFSLRERPIPAPGPNQALCKTLLISVDVANRAWMFGETYRDQLRPGDVMSALTVSEVVESADPKLQVGSIVLGQAGWQEWHVAPSSALRRIQPRGPLTHHVGVLGLTGLTAWFGLHKIGRVKAGETVVVSAAAGATGSVAAQLAQSAGARVVGVAGSAAKLRLLRDALGLDEAVDYHSDTFSDDLTRACPDGIDVYFDSVGGAVLDAAFELMNHFGRIVSCGAIAGYDEVRAPRGPLPHRPSSGSCLGTTSVSA